MVDRVVCRSLGSGVAVAEFLGHPLLNAGRSSGFRSDEKASDTTCSSTHSAPAFDKSVFNDGQDVIFFPLRPPASINVHGPWQIAAGTGRSASGLMTPPGNISRRSPMRASPARKHYLTSTSAVSCYTTSAVSCYRRRRAGTSPQITRWLSITNNLRRRNNGYDCGLSSGNSFTYRQ